MGHGRYIVRPVAMGARTERVSGRMNRVIVVDPAPRRGGLSPEDLVRAVPAHFVVEAGAAMEICVVVLPEASVRIPVSVDLVGEGASVRLSGIYLCRAAERVSFEIHLHHRAGRCRSQQLFKGIAGGSSAVEFSGLIEVAPDAQLTEAYQESRAILLTDSARVHTKPQLEIYADEVKCSHGAAVGSLNAEEQFYMRSRGIPEKEAKALQMLSFVSPVLQHVPEADREEVRSAVEEAIRSLSV